MTARTVEELLQAQLAACLAATEDCLAQSRLPVHDEDDDCRRSGELSYITRLMKASARLTEAMGGLRGERRQTIHVRREQVGGAAKGKGDKGEG
jgi:hypothetical protein